MKSILILPVALALATTFSSCETRRVVTTETTTTTTTTGSGGRERVITTLPSGYSVVTVRGTDYYRVGDVYYRSYPNRGYVVVPGPL